MRRLAPLEDRATRIQVEAERGFLRKLQGGCQVPIAGHAEVKGDAVRLRGLVANLDGTVVIRGERTGPVGEAARVGEQLAEELIARGAGEILSTIEKGPGLSAPRR
jgi:hydroxymethylbilane synthase